MDNSKNLINGKINNLNNYLQYCESLKHILEGAPLNNHVTKKRHLKELEEAQHNLYDVDSFEVFFQEINDEIIKFNKKNLDIEREIKKIEKEVKK